MRAFLSIMPLLAAAAATADESSVVRQPQQRNGEEIQNITFAGTVINKDFAEESCPSQWRYITACIATACSNYENICPPNVIDSTAPDMTPWDTTKVQDCDSFQDQVCWSLLSEDFPNEFPECCLFRCVPQMHDLARCVIQEMHGVDRYDCSVAKCKDPAPTPTPAPTPLSSTLSNIHGETITNMTIAGVTMNVAVAQKKCPTQWQAMVACSSARCESYSFLDVCADWGTKSDTADINGGTDKKNTTSCVAIKDELCSSYADCCFHDCLAAFQDMVLCYLNEGGDQIQCPQVNHTNCPRKQGPNPNELVLLKTPSATIREYTTETTKYYCTFRNLWTREWNPANFPRDDQARWTGLPLSMPISFRLRRGWNNSWKKA